VVVERTKKLRMSSFKRSLRDIHRMHSMENREHGGVRVEPVLLSPRPRVTIAQIPGNGLWIVPHSPQSKAHKIILTLAEKKV
jgi:hypothetical protein